MKNYLVEALAIQLEGETENLKALHRDLGAGIANATDYADAAEKLLDATTALYSVVFDVVARVWNINRPPEHPLKSYPPKAATIRHEMEQISAVLTLKAMSQKERDEIFAKLSQKTQAEDKS